MSREIRPYLSSSASSAAADSWVARRCPLSSLQSPRDKQPSKGARLFGRVTEMYLGRLHHASDRGNTVCVRRTHLSVACNVTVILRSYHPLAPAQIRKRDEIGRTSHRTPLPRIHRPARGTAHLHWRGPTTFSPRPYSHGPERNDSEVACASMGLIWVLV